MAEGRAQLHVEDCRIVEHGAQHAATACFEPVRTLPPPPAPLVMWGWKRVGPFTPPVQEATRYGSRRSNEVWVQEANDITGSRNTFQLLLVLKVVTGLGTTEALHSSLEFRTDFETWWRDLPPDLPHDYEGRSLLWVPNWQGGGLDSTAAMLAVKGNECGAVGRK